MARAKPKEKPETPPSDGLIPDPDPAYIPHPWASVLKDALDHGDRVLIIGDCGVGKTSQVVQIAAEERRPVRRVNLHGQTMASDLIGYHIAKPEEGVFWVDGILPQAMKGGHLLVLDEIDFAEPAILAVLHGVLEDPPVLVLAENGGEVVHPAEGFDAVATANTIGADSSQRSLYQGTNPMNEAFLDRFNCVIQVPWPDKYFEMDMLARQVPDLPKPHAALLVNVANELRAAKDKEEIDVTCSPRKVIDWGRKALRYGDVMAAARVTVLNKLSPTDREVVEGVLARWIGEKGV